jgi:hypothetical protein
VRATRDEVYAAIDGERDYQDSKSPTSETGGVHTVAEWLLYMQDYLNEAQHIASRTWGPEATHQCLDIMRKITAMGVACQEQNGIVERNPIWKMFAQ